MQLNHNFPSHLKSADLFKTSNSTKIIHSGHFVAIPSTFQAMSDFLDEVLKYALMLGAVFQLICIAAVVFLPNRQLDHRDALDSDDDTSVKDTVGTTTSSIRAILSGKKTRQDRKKRR